MRSSACRRVNLQYVNDAEYGRRCVGCLVLSQDRKIVLQRRDAEAPTYPNCLATFGGGIEAGEEPLTALIRELKEELGAVVSPRDVIKLGAITDPKSKNHELEYVYFWHYIYGSIKGCFEGEAKYFNDPITPQQDSKVMSDVIWVIQECNKRGLLR